MLFRKNNESMKETQQHLWDFINKMNADMVKLRAEQEKLTQQMLVLRGWVNRRLKLVDEEEEEEQEQLNTSGPLQPRW